jgi:hypothetical protein
MSDYIDKLTYSEPETPQTVVERDALGFLKSNSMVVPARAVSSAEIENREADHLRYAQTALPIPFWDGDTGTLEPLNTWDYAALKAAGVTPEEWEICVLEEHLERNPDE